PVILPALPAVARPHQAAQLDPDEEQVGVVRARRDPADMRRPRPRREAPGRLRWQLEQRLQLPPTLASIAALEQSARLAARVHRAVCGADGDREHGPLAQLAIEPAPAAAPGQ